MAKKKNPESGDQMDLIDFHPENSNEIIASAKRYKTAQIARIKALDKEKTEKEKLLSLIRKNDLQRTEDGKIKFTLDHYIITVTPRDELIQIKDVSEDAK